MKYLIYIVALMLTGVSISNAQVGPAQGATLNRDVWGDTWFPEWNTDGRAGFLQGYRNTVDKDPYPGIWSAEGDQLTVVKVIQGLGEDRWHQTAVLVFAEDGSGQWVRFGSWISPGDGQPTQQTLHFKIPTWARGEIKWEVWAWYGAASNITNLQYNLDSKSWINHHVKSHLSAAFGDTGINIGSIKPKQLVLRSIASMPIASVTPSVTNLPLGNSVSFTLSMKDGMNSAAEFSGNQVDSVNPPSLVNVTPRRLGMQEYTLSLPGFDTLSWDIPAPGNRVKLRTPHGELDVTNSRVFIVTSSADTGDYSMIQVNSAGVASEPSRVIVSLPKASIAKTTINVFAPTSTVTVTLQSAFYTVTSGPAAGRSFPRSWNDGANWHAYLARDGVGILVDAMSSDSAIASIELQAKTPNGDWADLVAPQAVDGDQPNGAGVKVSQRFSVRLGNVRPDKPLVPSDPSLAGLWQLRARALTSSGTWTDWSTAVPLTVELPLQSVTKTGQTLPPTKDAAWFNASEVKTYNLSLWIP